MSALEKVLRRARGTTSESAGGSDAGRVVPGASSVALRASCDAPGSVEFLTACIGTLGCWLFVIGTSLPTDFSEGGAAGHICTGGHSCTAGHATRDQDRQPCSSCGTSSASSCLIPSPREITCLVGLCCTKPYQAVAPPSTRKSAAVTQLASSEARYTANQATSSGWPRRLSISLAST